jgi:hypothetical protein
MASLTADREPDILQDAPENFEWQRFPEAEELLTEELDAFLQKHKFARELAERIKEETSTHFFNWVDHIRVPSHSNLPYKLTQDGGFIGDGDVFANTQAIFPRVIIDRSIRQPSVAINVECVADFVRAHDLDTAIEGEERAPLRQIHVDEGDNRFTVLERHGYKGFDVLDTKNGHHFDPESMKEFSQKWTERPRDALVLEKEVEQFEYALDLAKKMTQRLGPGRAADIMLACERDYWMSRNLAGRIQKERLDNLGLGWGNIRDHHTFRSTRRNFLRLIEVLGAFGFEKRERFYAGEEAGWGAQVMQHPVTSDVLFCDVDLNPEDIKIDFSRDPLPPTRNHSTVGRWCELHGDSFLEAGVHHIEAQFNFDHLVASLREKGIETMDPFTEEDDEQGRRYLTQAFTVGEKWKVHGIRLSNAMMRSAIDMKMYNKLLQPEDRFAVGSHLEGLDRSQGFAGFKEKAVNNIMTRIDPQRVAMAEMLQK